MKIIKESWAVDLVSCMVMSTAQLFQDLEFWITYTLDIGTIILIFLLCYFKEWETENHQNAVSAF